MDNQQQIELQKKSLELLQQIRLQQQVIEFEQGFTSGGLLHEATARGDKRAVAEIKEKFFSGRYKTDPSVPRYK